MVGKNQEVAADINLKKAEKHKLFYFIANAIVYRNSDKRCLLLKRNSKNKIHPGKYCVPGGKLEWSDLDIDKPTRLNGNVLDFENAIEKLLKREIKEEANITIENSIKYINNVAYIRPDGTPSMMVKYAVKYKSGKVILESKFSSHR
ncbi:NUDIX domain-containing protein [Patescibacteria group bacterium]